MRMTFRTDRRTRPLPRRRRPHAGAIRTGGTIAIAVGALLSGCADSASADDEPGSALVKALATEICQGSRALAAARPAPTERQTAALLPPAPQVQDPLKGVLLASPGLAATPNLGWQRSAPTPSASTPGTLSQGQPGTAAPVGSLTNGADPARTDACRIDFTDPAALFLAAQGLWFDRVYMPWFQACGTKGYVDFRPTVYEHFHLGFAAADVIPCNDRPDAAPGRDPGDGSCQPVDATQEPRTHMSAHEPREFVHLRAMTSIDYRPLAFDLEQIRVLGSKPVRLCYRQHLQPTDGAWLAYQVDGHDKPGIWKCWAALDAGLWDLSAWATDVDEVRITGADVGVGTFMLDDMQLRIR
ncbi:MAG: hypothetical protein AB7P21_27000 [Lautropia sp.]